MRICVFDLEIKKSLKDLDWNEEKAWGKVRQGEGGISALAIYDYQEQWCYVYDDHELEDIAAHLESADIVVGYSSVFFDRPVVEAMLKRKLVLKEHIDIYELISKSLFKHSLPRRKGEYKLGVVCNRTIGKGKMEFGANAPELYKDTRYGRLFRYCADDVRLTRDLFEHIRREGGIISVDQTFLPVTLPEDLRIS